MRKKPCSVAIVAYEYRYGAESAGLSGWEIQWAFVTASQSGANLRVSRTLADAPSPPIAADGSSQTTARMRQPNQQQTRFCLQMNQVG